MYDYAHFLSGNAAGKRRGIWPLFFRDTATPLMKSTPGIVHLFPGAL